MTETEAKTKWCPFSRQFIWNLNGAAAINRSGTENTYGQGIGPCLGTDCMAWRGAPDNGYCGLAGVPPNVQP